MSSCQALFAPSWQAGLSGSQWLPKSLKNIDVESVNIEKTCDKLCLALNDNLMRIQGNNIDDSEKQCIINKSNISFRDFSNIWFGTLKIYQQQVNTLFRLSQDLLCRSSNYEEKRPGACKRNSSLTSHKLVKKRRLTLNESCKVRHLKTNYAKLLDDLEELTRETTPLTLPEETQDITGITQYQVREITLREISAQTFMRPEELDEDGGFGEATHEEIAEFFNCFEVEDTLNMKRMALKRKLSCVQESPIENGCLIKDYLDEPTNNDTPFDGEFLKTSPSKRSRTHSLYEDKIIESIHFLPDSGVLQAGKIKKESMPDIENTSIYCGKNKRRKLVIDACTKIDMSDVMAALKSSQPFTKHVQKRTLKSVKTKRKMLACDLLTRFNSRSLTLALSFKQKIFLSREQFERDYLNLLREIFKCDYKEELASQIYPKWIFFGDEQLAKNKQQHLKKSKSRNTFTILPEADVCYFHNVPTRNSANIASDDEILNLGINHNNTADMLNTSICDEWRPHGVILKLLNLWRSNQTNKIAAHTLFKLANNQINRGLGFNSLLHLSKMCFVNLTTHPGSIELQNIKAGNNINRNVEYNFK